MPDIYVIGDDGRPELRHGICGQVLNKCLPGSMYNLPVTGPCELPERHAGWHRGRQQRTVEDLVEWAPPLEHDIRVLKRGV